MLYIALIEIAHRRTYPQWLCWALNIYSITLILSKFSDAGSVEQILAKIMNQSTFMEINYENPDLLSFYVPLKLNLQENEINILQKSAKVKRNVISDEESNEEKGTFFLTIDATHFKITFWIGFISIEEAQIFRNEMKL